ncbi:hypothetical protein BVRB_1g014040 [Beta vulgaris subsp. vulgaris]|nr:hypothetical protein BVRB_1g014040 [Beta vulgaris subsp. vulgaris]
MTMSSPSQSSTTSISCYCESCPSPTTTTMPLPSSLSPSSPSPSSQKTKAMSCKQNHTTSTPPITPTLKYVSRSLVIIAATPIITVTITIIIIIITIIHKGKTIIYFNSSQSSTTCTPPNTLTAPKYVSQFAWSLPQPQPPRPSPLILSTKAKMRPNLISTLMTSHVHRKSRRATTYGCMACFRPNSKKQKASEKIGK